MGFGVVFCMVVLCYGVLCVMEDVGLVVVCFRGISVACACEQSCVFGAVVVIAAGGGGGS